MSLRFRPKAEQVRLVYTSTPETAFPKQDKVFAVIGPFHGHLDKPDLQKALQTLLRGWNITSDPATNSNNRASKWRRENPELYRERQAGYMRKRRAKEREE